MLPQGFVMLAGVFGHRLDCEDQAEELCSVRADLSRIGFHYALHCVMSWVRLVHSVLTVDGQGVPCYNLLHDRLAREVLPN